MENINETSVALIKNFIMIKLVNTVQDNYDKDLPEALVESTDDILTSINHHFNIRREMSLAFLSLIGDCRHSGSYVNAESKHRYDIDIKAFFSKSLNGYEIQIDVYKKDRDFDEYILHITRDNITLI